MTRPPIRVLAAVGLAAIMAACLGACSSSSASEDADPTATTSAANLAATTALQTAAAAMEAAPSFRFLATVVAGGVTTTISGEAVAPDKVHQTVMSADGQLTETTYIGSDVWVKDTTGTWHSAPGTASAATSTATFAALSTATALNVSSADVLFELKGDSSFIQSSSGPQDVAGDAVITDGTITKLTYGTVGSAGSMLVTIEYSDVGAALTVEPPAA